MKEKNLSFSNSERVKEKVYPNIPEKFSQGYPDGYRPWLDGWSFKPDQLEEKLPDGTYKMLTLDVSISKDAWAKEMNEIEDPILRNKMIKRSYPCPNDCRSCYEKLSDVDNHILTWEENRKIIDNACELGLKSVKFLGPGEIINDPDLFKYLDYFEEKGLTFGVFTKPAILLDETEAQKVFGISSEELCEKIASYKCVRLLMNFASADPETEIKMVDPKNKDFAKTFVENRNKAIELFSKYGMNDDPENQRLALICAPVLKSNIDEAFDIFKWGVKRNIPVVVAPTMLSGGRSEEQEEVKDSNFKEVTLVDLWVDIYSWLIKEKILTMEQLEKEGIAPYAGFACDQFITGMFVRKDGRVQACPGNETKDFRYTHNIVGEDLEKVWKNSMGYKMRKEMVESGEIKQLGCPAKQPGLITKDGEMLIKEGCGSFPDNFGDKVLSKVREKVGKE